MDLPWHKLAAEVLADTQFYLSHDGRTALGPFPLSEVKWMIRCRHFSPDVLVRPAGELGWTSYRHYLSKAVMDRFSEAVRKQLRHWGVISDDPQKNTARFLFKSLLQRFRGGQRPT